MKGRPFILDPLFRAVATLSGVGPKYAKLYEKLLGGGKILDLLFHKPVDFVLRKHCDSLAEAPLGQTICVSVTIDKHTPSPRRGQPTRVRARDPSGFVDLVFFNAHGAWIEKQYPIGATLVIAGKIEDFRGQRQITHPDLIGLAEDAGTIDPFEVVYPLTAGVTTKPLRKSLLAALSFVPDLPEWDDPAHKLREGWKGWKESLTALHHPKTAEDLEPLHPARMRLAYDELLANQLTLALVRNRQRKLSGRSFPVSGPLRRKLLASLPWQLTEFQQSALAEIDADMAAPSRMLRLLQGDVGSGKTVVAALAMINAIDGGAQAALMAPTEILVRQHAENLAPLLAACGVKIAVLTGRDKGKLRESVLKEIADGTAQIVLGTHALFQDGVEFKDLGLAVIDEQHRFGVHQRLQLSNKGRGTDVLVMTATPIPRTLALTAYGDMEVSRILGKPPGRKPIDTRLISQEKFDEMVERLKPQIAADVKVYWVCPLVEESELLDLAAASERFDILQQHFGDKVGLIHGRMKPQDKDDVMQKFINGNTRLLVATTVIEVGVDVPDATIMVIEHAERFGLAQLHQLRGRVGRGEKPSFCFLMYAPPLGKTARERLETLRKTEDGFLIAEKDLTLRGSGEILGTRQSGLASFRLADLSAHSDLLLTARDDSKLILDRDPELQSPRGEALRTLLYLFERDQAISYLRSG